MATQGERAGADADRLADAVLTASRDLVQATTNALVELAPALNVTDFRVLALLAERGPVRLIDIADALQVTGTTATRLADRLAAQKMVARVRQTDDRREIRLALADAGRTLLVEVSARRRQFVAARLRNSGRPDRLVAIRILEQLAAAPPLARTAGTAGTRGAIVT